MMSSGSPLDELQEITRRLSCDDESVLDLIIKSIVPKVIRLISLKFNNLLTREDIEDAISHSLFRLWQNRSKISSKKGNIQAWLFVVAKNYVIDQFRHTLTNKSLATNIISKKESSSFKETDTKLIQDIKTIFNQMSEREKLIIKSDLKSIEIGMRDKDLAAELGISEGALRALRFRTKRKFRIELSKLGHDVIYW